VPPTEWAKSVARCALIIDKTCGVAPAMCKGCRVRRALSLIRGYRLLARAGSGPGS
jgi:hypothetical protein